LLQNAVSKDEEKQLKSSQTHNTEPML
jgi:hypothetical protein